MDPFTLALIGTAIGGGLGAAKGAFDGKKGNMLSSTLMGAGLGAGAGAFGPSIAGAFGMGGGAAAGAGAAAKGTAAAGKVGGALAGGAPVPGSELAGGGALRGLPASSGGMSSIGDLFKSPGMKKTMGSMFQNIGGAQGEREIPDYVSQMYYPVANNVPVNMDISNPYMMSAAPLPGQGMMTGSRRVA